MARAWLRTRADREVRRLGHAQGQHADPRPDPQGQRRRAAAAVGQKGLSITSLTGRLFGGEFTASGTLAPRGNGAELTAQANIKGGKLDEFAKSVTGASLAKGPFDLGFTVQGEGLSPPGLVAGLSGQGSFSLGAGALQALSPDPLRRVAATAAKKTIKADKDEIAAQAQSVRDTITKGIYKYAPVQFAFDIKNGTLRLTPATLTGPGAETKINGYIELASLKLDSEWALKLAGANSGDVPPVGLVFTGALNKAGEISPAVDTAAIEAYLTMRRMQEGVEQLETLDVSGKSQPDIEAAPEDQTAAVPSEPVGPDMESAAPDETAQPEPARPAAEAEASPVPPPRPAPSAAAMPSATELLHEGEPSTALPDAAEIPPPAPVVPLPSEAAIEPSAAPEPAPPAAAAPTPVTKPAPPPTVAAPPPAAKPAPVAPVAAPAPAPKPVPSVVAEPTPAPKPAPAAAVAEPAPAPKPAPAAAIAEPAPAPKPAPAAAVAEPAPPVPAEKPSAAPQTEAAATPEAEPAPCRGGGGAGASTACKPPAPETSGRSARRLEEGHPYLRRRLDRLSSHPLQHVEPDRRRQARLIAPSRAS